MAWSETLTMLANNPFINDAITTFLINQNIVLYHTFSLDIYEYRQFY